MKQAKHTQGKWIVVNSGGTITSEFQDGYKVICTLENNTLAITPEIKANAAHIVKCVNNHEQLIDALESAKNIFDFTILHTHNPTIKKVLNQFMEEVINPTLNKVTDSSPVNS